MPVGIELGFRVVRHNLVRRDSQGLFIQILPNGTSTVELRHAETGVKVTLTPERSFGRSQMNRLRSVSFPQRPDVVIEVDHPDHGSRLILVDPKYKLESELVGSVAELPEDELESDESPAERAIRPKKIDIDKMHAYRDAIRDSSDHRVVD